ncbi:aminoglycoside phosphotransferase family protein (plasmid) [Streptomyces sp. Qhu-G9]|uniref:phosphotransferase family protein n=1 Tax=Streptomyces sp. Qhu-G9 TaxID=3452799 RepID=UPI0022AC138E|nr:aminoglycoside phosphotransferase family protein [Streptomyces aurantiacus]WAU78367.1 aminoglycoside phosphotransferase family protein [Streptomyces aurantiacus]
MRVDAIDEFVCQAQRSGAASNGYHNLNYVFPLSERAAQLTGTEQGAPVLVRVPQAESVRVVIRTWPSEADLLEALKDLLPHVPRCLARTATATVLTYVAGTPFSRFCPAGKPVDPLQISDIAHLLAQTTAVRREALPPLPDYWPQDDEDSQSYLQTLALSADRQIRQPNWPVYGDLFNALGVAEDVLVRLAERVPGMTHRPYSLLHADLHRDNLVVTEHGTPRLIAVDWELATYGDPLHDLATHLIRMQYPESQKQEVIDAWAGAVDSVTPAALKGLDTDLAHYIAFEQAQSIFPDVIRAVNSLAWSPYPDDHDERLNEAASGVHRALEDAAKPLGLKDIPSLPRVRDLLHQWQAPSPDTWSPPRTVQPTEHRRETPAPSPLATGRRQTHRTARS